MRKRKYSKEDNSLVNDLLELRRLSNGKAVIYIIIPCPEEREGGEIVQEIVVARPKRIISSSVLDTTLKRYMKNMKVKFSGKINSEPHEIWEKLLKKPYTNRPFFRFDYPDESIMEMTMCDMDEILDYYTENEKIREEDK